MQVNNWINWIIFTLLCIIWGSSFILMKVGLEHLSSVQVAAIRLFTAGACMLPILFHHLRKVSIKRLPIFFIAGITGNGIPAFLFCLAETRIDSGLAGVLNALTPLFALMAGILFFNAKANKYNISGIIIGFMGICLLFFTQINTLHYWPYGLLIIAATICYGINVNIIRHYLHDAPSLQIASVAFSFLSLLMIPVLLHSHIITTLSKPGKVWISAGAAILLGFMNTAVSNALYYVLIKRAGVLFASIVTYGMPVVALGWGYIAGEAFSWWQLLSLSVILAGVYLVSR